MEEAWSGEPETRRPFEAVDDEVVMKPVSVERASAWRVEYRRTAPVAWKVEEEERVPETAREEATEEEAEEMMPPTAEVRPVVRKVEATDEDAPAANPPEASRVNTDEEATFCTRRASPVCAVRTLRVRLEAVVEVAAMVATALTSGEEVPTARLSVKVVSETTVPESVKPPALAPVDAQVRFPLPSVCKKLVAVSLDGQV